MTFSGAKLALFLGPDLLVIRRDDRRDIPFPGRWDLPGGGREAGESPEDCVLRETFEEVGLQLRRGDLVWSRSYHSDSRPCGTVWFFAAHLPLTAREAIRFGDEGQGWALMPPETYCVHALAIPQFARQLRLYLDGDYLARIA